jgi:hypothetical protein
MKYVALLAAALAVSCSAVSAQAKPRWNYDYVSPWHDDESAWVDDEDDIADDEEDDGFMSYRESDRLPERVPKRLNVVRRTQDDRLWWLEDNARSKLEQRKSKRRATIVKKSTPKPKMVTSVAPKAVVKTAVKAAVKPKPQIASLQKPAVMAKPKPVLATPQKPKASVEKTIGCTAGAAVVTGYGFAEVRPKTCTGKTYAYTAARAGKNYDIQLTAASGEIIDVKKR